MKVITWKISFAFKKKMATEEFRCIFFLLLWHLCKHTCTYRIHISYWSRAFLCPQPLQTSNILINDAFINALCYFPCLALESAFFSFTFFVWYHFLIGSFWNELTKQSQRNSSKNTLQNDLKTKWQRIQLYWEMKWEWIEQTKSNKNI